MLRVPLRFGGRLEGVCSGVLRQLVRALGLRFVASQNPDKLVCASTERVS